eukprot:57324-Amphidinium_carterae.1
MFKWCDFWAFVGPMSRHRSQHWPIARLLAAEPKPAPASDSLAKLCQLCRFSYLINELSSMPLLLNVSDCRKRTFNLFYLGRTYVVFKGGGRRKPGLHTPYGLSVQQVRLVPYKMDGTKIGFCVQMIGEPRSIAFEQQNAVTLGRVLCS